MLGRDTDINLRLTNTPEFDAWRWHKYWVPLDVVIEFKRDVYLKALQELSRFLNPPPKPDNQQYFRLYTGGLPAATGKGKMPVERKKTETAESDRISDAKKMA